MKGYGDGDRAGAGTRVEANKGAWMGTGTGAETGREQGRERGWRPVDEHRMGIRA